MTASTKEVVQAWYENLAKGNIEAVINGLAEDIDWNIPKTEYNSIIPWVGRCKGREEIVEAFKKRDAALTLKAFKPRELIVEGDKAIVFVNERSICKRTGVEFVLDPIVQHLTVKDGLIVQWAAYYDPTPIVEAFRANLSAELIEAVDNDDVERIRMLIREGADPNTRDPSNGLTVLMSAACHANLKMVELLLEAGADVLTTDSKTGATPLHKAAQGGNVEIAKLLIEAGVFVDAVTPTMGHTPIMDALWYKWPDFVKLLIDEGTNLELGTHYGFTLDDHLNFELNVNQDEEKQKFVRVKEMLDARRDDIKHEIESQKVMSATNKGDAVAVKKLIDDKAEVNTVYPHINSFLDGHTPLLVAARDGHTEIVRMLLRANAEVRVQDWVFKGAPIHKATYNGNAEILSMLVDHPDIDLDVQGPINGYTPLHDALWHGFTECAGILVNAGARLDLKGHDGKLPLDVAIETYGEGHEMVDKIRGKMATK